MRSPQYEVFALRYARMEATQADVLIFPEDHAAPMPLDFYIWAIRGEGRTIVLDTGFDAASGKRRGRAWLRSPIDALKTLDIDPATVEDVVLSHMHWDHAGHWAEFSNARFHLQDAEMAYCTGRCMGHPPLRRTFDVQHVTTAVEHVFAERVTFHDGTEEIAPGITLHLVGGHSGGMQVMRVPTARGWVVLASDAAHFWYNIRKRNPFFIVHDLGRLMEGYVLCEKLADGPDHIIPGHDPEVRRRFPHVGTDPDTMALHLEPVD
ncbi:N-acyl homoserine lactonase family protein [Bauldia litoralis]|uniref:Glyoxylase, beta-lactamase superfamily II n=1 Tax=Bauldia litoralis TaxID=665467 RepID=A0A1G6B7F1_9HYPH|nr:N-acyl homoserine lactonase family protein [Bauldia litoralis]SDB16562.1 Glyoxylase, beta-lactamase superfamily II [Bauldia litoralis]